MALPAGVALAAKYGPAAYGIISGLLKGKSKQQKAQEAAMARLQNIAEHGLDPSILNRAVAILNARNQGEQSGVLSRLSAGGIDPSSGLAQEAVGATRRSLGARQGEAQSLFNEQSEAAKLRANEQLAGMPVPEDTSTGDLIGSLLTNLEARGVFDKKAAPEQSDSVGVQLPDELPGYSELSNRLSRTYEPPDYGGISNSRLINSNKPLLSYNPDDYVTSLPSNRLNRRNRLSQLNPRYYRP
jgi:hypothetical protein